MSVDQPLADLHEDLVEVGGEHVQRPFPGPQVLLQFHDFVSGLREQPAHVNPLLGRVDIRECSRPGQSRACL
jgi:hypothetical protein